MRAAPLPDPLFQPQPEGLTDLVISGAEGDHGQQELEQQHEDGVASATRGRKVLLARLQFAQSGQDDFLAKKEKDKLIYSIFVNNDKNL